MKSSYRLATAMLAGAALGVLAVHEVHAQVPSGIGPKLAIREAVDRPDMMPLAQFGRV